MCIHNNSYEDDEDNSDGNDNDDDSTSTHINSNWDKNGKKSCP